MINSKKKESFDQSKLSSSYCTFHFQTEKTSYSQKENGRTSNP